MSKTETPPVVIESDGEKKKDAVVEQAEQKRAPELSVEQKQRLFEINKRLEELGKAIPAAEKEVTDTLRREFELNSAQVTEEEYKERGFDMSKRATQDLKAQAYQRLEALKTERAMLRAEKGKISGER